MTLLNLNNVTLSFPGSIKPALNRLNYTINQSDFVILLGSNGSGKSSLLKLLHRHYQPNAGQINLLGKPLIQHQHKKFRDHVAVLTQNCSDSLFNSLTVFENYLLIKPSHHAHSRETERQFLKQYLYDFNPNLSDKLNCLIEHLSGGEKQALALAFCLLKPPALLLLDEHTSALDPKTSQQIMQLTHKKIIEHNITCILTTHDLDIAMHYGNRILILREGEIHKSFDQQEKLSLTKESLMTNYY